jgi:hypothetical protein
VSPAPQRRRATTTRPSSLLFSLGVHAALAGVIVYGAWIGKILPLGGAHPGSAAAGAIHANLVSQVPGGAIPMPSPVVAPTQNRLANDLPAEGKSKPLPRTAPRHSVALPAYNPEEIARKQAAAELKKLAQADRSKDQDNRVAYGAGGRVSFSATSSAQGAGGSGGVSFGDANFGNLYTEWVNHLRDRLQYYWNQQPRDPVIPAGLKVTVTMTVHAAGTIDSIHYLSRANSVEVNDMAFQSVRQMASQERFPLPPGYNHNSLVVTVTFQIN